MRRKREASQTLTKSELEVMKILWAQGESCDVHEIIDSYEEPKPAYTTVSTFLKILQHKGYVGFERGRGKQYLYFPVVSHDDYTRFALQDLKHHFFGGSTSSFISFFVKEEKLSEEEIAELLQMIQNQ